MNAYLRTAFGQYGDRLADLHDIKIDNTLFAVRAASPAVFAIFDGKLIPVHGLGAMHLLQWSAVRRVEHAGFLVVDELVAQGLLRRRGWILMRLGDAALKSMRRY